MKQLLTECTRRPNGANMQALAREKRSPDTPLRPTRRERAHLSILNAIERLPDILQVTVVLHEMHSLSHEDISSVTGCPVYAVRQHLARARRAIASELAPTR